jgi:hypothetical protein
VPAARHQNLTVDPDDQLLVALVERYRAAALGGGTRQLDPRLHRARACRILRGGASAAAEAAAITITRRGGRAGAAWHPAGRLLSRRLRERVKGLIPRALLTRELGDRRARQVRFTFDDGPNHEVTPRVREYVADLIQCQDLVRSYTGEAPHLYRPPGGYASPATLAIPPLFGFDLSSAAGRV